MLRLTLEQINQLGLRISASTLSGNAPPVRAKQRTRAPDDVLWEAVSARYSEAEREFKGVVPDRRFRIDIALPSLRIAVEVDGWAYHGQHRNAHAADRTRQNLVAVQGWLVLRFTTGQIFKKMDGVIATIESAVRRQQSVLAAE